jgi:drug/metabolite transporter (DMT)-like permease
MKLRSNLKNFKALPFILLLGLMFGSTMVISRFTIGQMEPGVYNSLRLIIVVICFTLVFALSPGRQWPHDKKLWLHAGIWGMLGLAIPMMSFITALKYQSSGVTSLLITLNVAITVILAHFFLSDETLTPRKFLGLVIAFAGAALILLRGETGLGTLGKADWRGYALVGAGVLGTSVGYIYARKYLQASNEFQVVSVRMVSAALVIIPFTLTTTGFDLSGVRWSGVLALIFSAIVGTFLTFQVEFLIVKRFGASATSEASYIVPVVATGLGALLLGEHITMTIVIGMLIIFVGITLLNQ